jgi:hypothetical protein
MDFKGYFVTGDGKRCDPFTVTDAHSRYLIRCQIVSRIDLSEVRAICEAAMREYGGQHGSGQTTAHRHTWNPYRWSTPCPGYVSAPLLGSELPVQPGTRAPFD